MAVRFTRTDGTPLPINGFYSGSAAFFLASGPSLLQEDLDALKAPHLIKFGVNNSPATIKPNLWTMVDDTKSFLLSTWMNPSIIKFIPDGKPEHTLWDNNEWRESNLKVKDCPGVVLYPRNEYFQAEKFLGEDTVNWGNHTNRCACGWIRPDRLKKCPSCYEDQWRKDKCQKCGYCRPKQVRKCESCGLENRFGSRSVMLASLKIMWEIGVRTVFLLGCDFSMQAGKQNYHFKQARSKGSVKNNNATYEMLSERFDNARPYFKKAGFNVYNCTPNSGLKSFDYMPTAEAIEIASKYHPAVENTEGLYDRKVNEKKKRKGKIRTLEEFINARRDLV